MQQKHRFICNKVLLVVYVTFKNPLLRQIFCLHSNPTAGLYLWESNQKTKLSPLTPPLVPYVPFPGLTALRGGSLYVGRYSMAGLGGGGVSFLDSAISLRKSATVSGFSFSTGFSFGRRPCIKEIQNKVSLQFTTCKSSTVSTQTQVRDIN